MGHYGHRVSTQRGALIMLIIAWTLPAVNAARDESQGSGLLKSDAQHFSKSSRGPQDGMGTVSGQVTGGSVFLLGTRSCR